MKKSFLFASVFLVGVYSQVVCYGTILINKRDIAYDNLLTLCLSSHPITYKKLVLKTFRQKTRHPFGNKIEDWQRICLTICASPTLGLDDKKDLLAEIFFLKYSIEDIFINIDCEVARQAPLLIWSVCMGYDALTKTMLIPEKIPIGHRPYVELNRTHLQGTALYYAVILKNYAIVKALIKAGVSLNHAAEPSRMTPLMMAVIHGELKIVSWLLEAGAGVWPKNIQGLDVLEIANMGVNTQALTHESAGMVDVRVKIIELLEKYQNKERQE